MTSSLYRRLHNLFTTTTTTTPTISTPKPKPKPQPQPKPQQKNPISLKTPKFNLIAKKFKKASDSPTFRLRNFYYQTTILRLAKAKQFPLIHSILSHQKQYPDITNERFSVRLISLYGKSGMFDHARQLFDEMPQLNCPQTVISFNALLSACVNAKQFDKVGEVFKEIPAKISVEPDLISYNTVIKAFCEMGLLDDAELVVTEMEKNGLDPDLITFNTLLDGFYRNERFEDGERLWGVMEKKGLVANARSYNAKLRGLKVCECVELIGEMRRKGVKPDVYSFNVLIKGFCKEGDLEEAKRWYGEIGEGDCGGSIRSTFMMLLPLACEKLDFDFGFELCKEAISRKFVVDTATMQRVVDGLVKELKIEEAEELVKLGKSNQYYHFKLKLPTDE